MSDRKCRVPSEVIALQRRYSNIDRRLRFVEAKLGIIRPAIEIELAEAEAKAKGSRIHD